MFWSVKALKRQSRVSHPTAGGLLSTGTASIMLRTIFPYHLFLGVSHCETTKTGKYNCTTTAIQIYATYSSYWHSKVIKTKIRQTLVFDPDRCSDDLRA